MARRYKETTKLITIGTEAVGVIVNRTVSEGGQDYATPGWSRGKDFFKELAQRTSFLLTDSARYIERISSKDFFFEDHSLKIVLQISIF